jgi:ATP-binding cassette, subfamily F, member 3
MLSFQQISLSRGTKVLFDNASATIFQNQKVGLVGKNGCGKSSLFAVILNQLQVDAGDVILHSNILTSVLQQQLPHSEHSILDYVLEGDEAYISWNAKLKIAIEKNDHDMVSLCHEHLQQMDAYSKPALAASILVGLGFPHEKHLLTVNSFSGGWRMRLSLARCLLKPADLYLLDEPTNHLDLEAILWLERWLKNLSATVLVISHDRDFLDGVVDRILHIESMQMKLFTGNYSNFEKVRAEQLLQQQALYDSQQRQIEHMMSYVNRFKAKASKAKQAQSRLKAIERMEIVAQAHIDNPFNFEFFTAPTAGTPFLKCNGLDVGYVQNHPIVKQVFFELNPQDRIALMGLNGQGKSTFIKTLVGDIQPLAGELYIHPKVQIGYFAQHQLDQLDLDLSPLQTILKLTPHTKEQDVRQFLGGYHFQGDVVSHPIRHFSGGEKARLALAKLVWQKPNLLLLDEPTNHLDIEMKTSIEMALQTFEGAVILISHDRHLVKTTVEQFYLIHDQKLSEFDGDLDDYANWLMNLQRVEFNKTVDVKKSIDHKEQKIIKNRIKKLENLIDEYQKKLDNLNQELCSETLYEPGQQKALLKLQEQQSELEKLLMNAENEWLELMEKIENV